MAPSPAAGKSEAQRTPTKLGRKPQSQASSKLGESAKSVSSAAKKPQSTASSSKGGDTDPPSLPSRPSVGGIKDTATGAAEQAKGAAQGAGEKAQSTAGDAASQAQGAAEEATSKLPGGTSEDEGVTGQVGDTAEKAAGSVEDLKEQAPKPISESEDTTAGVQESLEDTGDDATEKAGEVADETENNSATDGAQDTVEGVKNQAGGILAGAKGLAGRASGLAGRPSGQASDIQQLAGEAASQAQGAAGNFQNEAGGLTEDAQNQLGNLKEQVEGATGQQLPDLPDLNILKGREVQEDGMILDDSGNAIGRLVEGDAEDLQGYPIGDEGEILDDDGDLVGRTEILPETIQDYLNKAKEAADGSGLKLPGLDILEGLTVDAVGQILNDDGDTVGQLVEGNPQELKGKTFNANGEILDDDGNVIGRAEVHPDAANLIDQAASDVEGTEGAEGLVDGAKDTAEGAVDEAKDTVEGIAPTELPGIEALEGQELNSEGEIVDSEGNVLGQLAEGDAADLKGLTVNDKGEVVDDEGNVLGKVELAEGAAEKLANITSTDIRILEGRKVNKKGKILNEEGEEIGEISEGEVADLAGKIINDKGEVLDQDGNVIGKVQIVPGEAADEALAALKEKLIEAGEIVDGIKTIVPELNILEGLKVNKKGQVLNEDGDPIGELEEGDIAACAGKKINENGEVLDADGNVIGKVKTLPQEVEVSAEEAEGAVEDAAEEAEDAAPELPPLSVLEGLTVNKAGKLIDSEGNVIGELVEGDAKKLSKAGVTCDDQGQFWDSKGHVIGRAQTLPQEDHEEEAPFAGLEGLIVVQGGFVQDENGNTVGQVTDGDAAKLVGRAVDEDGDIIDKKGTVIGHAERLEEAPEAEPVDLSVLAGRTVNKQGNVIGDEGVPIGRLVEGNPKELAGKSIDENGQIWNDKGQVIGRCELIPEEEREAKPEGPFAGLQGLRVVADGKIADEDENIVGEIVEGNPKRLIGLSVDEDGDIVDRYGNVKGRAEPIPEEEEEIPDLSILDGKTLNKQGFVVDENGLPLARLVEGSLSDLAGRKTDGEGLIHSDTGKVVGRCELIPENERVSKPEGPFSGLEGLRVNKEGKVEDENGNIVGEVVEGNVKRLVGNAVDEDGDIIDKYGNVKGHAEPVEEDEIDYSSLAGCTVNKAGNVVNANGAVVGKIVDGEVKDLIGKQVDGQGQIWDNAGNVVGHAEPVQGADSGPEGIFAGFETITVAKDGTVVTPDGTVVGRLIEGDAAQLVGYKVDADGEIVDKNGNLLGKAERWEPEEKERRVNPMSGHRVNKEGEIRDENGDLLGKLTEGDLGHCVGMEVDDNGHVVDNDGNIIGEATLIENLQDDELSEEELQRRQDAELADKMANICQQTLERVQPVCKQITDHIEAADRTPKEELDEEELVNNVKPLIEEAARILQECNGSLRGLDPDGRIAAQAKGRAGTREATPEEYRLADLLKELTTTVVTTIDNAKKRIQDMPHAKKKLNPLWALLTEPLFQIIAAVGLLLSGVLGLVGKLLNGLGLGGLVNGLLGGLGIDKLLGGLGLGSVSEALGFGGKKEKKKGGGGSLPLVGGILGGK